MFRPILVRGYIGGECFSPAALCLSVEKNKKLQPCYQKLDDSRPPFRNRVVGVGNLASALAKDVLVAITALWSSDDLDSSLVVLASDHWDVFTNSVHPSSNLVCGA